MERPYEHLGEKELFARYERKDPLATKEMAYRYQLSQAQRLLDEFASWYGRQPTSIEELETFVTGPRPRKL